MNSDKSWLGRSLKVPSVQEFVKQKPTSVPSRYIRPNQAPPLLSPPSPLPELPVIDMQRLLSDSGNNEINPELQKLDSACREWGFFQLINHGVSCLLVEKVKLGTEEFFKMPKEEKQRFAQRDGDIEGLGQVFVVSEEQKLDWADMLYVTTKPVNYRKPHLFPQFPLPFRDDLEEYLGKLQNLAMEILSQMAKALGMKIEDMNAVFEGGRQSMRINYYPPCPQPDLVDGLCPHSDLGGLTILLQISDVKGLQIKKDGGWIPVLPLPGAFVVNIGDSLEIVTNGTYRSVEHRAIVNSEKERLSIATFHSPKIEANLGPAPSIITHENQPKFRNITGGEFTSRAVNESSRA